MLGFDVIPTVSSEEVVPLDTLAPPTGEQKPRTGGVLPNPSEAPPLD
ncbi:MAG: hypothetical protein JOZ19_12320 [Rubrobacter sp.]|nr:hypothetical protein [Rubrobacter sp.]